MTAIAVPFTITDHEEIFTHELEGVVRHFAVRPMLDIAKRYGGRCDQILSKKIPVDRKQANYIRKNMGIEQWRVDRLGGGYLHIPLLAIQWNEEDPPTVTIIDGNHRFVKLAELGYYYANCYIFKREAWEQLLLPLRPEFNTMGKESRMREYEEMRDKNAASSQNYPYAHAPAQQKG